MMDRHVWEPKNFQIEDLTQSLKRKFLIVISAISGIVLRLDEMIALCARLTNNLKA